MGKSATMTPQLVIDGTHQVVGSDKRAIENALLDAIKTPKPALDITVENRDGVVNASASDPRVCHPATRRSP
jgi:hypothetical protein